MLSLGFTQCFLTDDKTAALCRRGPGTLHRYALLFRLHSNWWSRNGKSKLLILEAQSILNVVLANASPLECEIHLLQLPDPSVLSGRVILNCVPWTSCTGLRGEAFKEKMMWMLNFSTSGRVINKKGCLLWATMKLPFFVCPFGK